ncbi:TPA: hypothetical protein I8Y86_001969 [Legionella pneumophila]|nr:hypothetical protein [Legionella pneumophila]HAT9634663.1 hypothetical protein [Legionella pneumophila subsp. pneumophila]HAT1806326.1 hypothetical protein [Legionella pneumophila]HAT1847963.1 hypothetical protein [Legionella pneumophila]HAT1873201.1 hypothetical protein [Legionella pneumophila]HAT8737488.1 hypothetical protein [Legionella pneumophila]
MNKVLKKILSFCYGKLVNRKPIAIYVNSFTDAPVLAMLACQLIVKKENVIFVLAEQNESLVSRILSFINDFNGMFVFLSELNVHEKKDLSDKVKEVENRYQKYNLNFDILRALYISLSEELSKFEEFFMTHKPKLLIVGEDGISSNACLIQAARSKKIPILDIPYGYGSYMDLENSLDQKSKNEELYHSDDGAGLAVKDKFPHWIKKGKFSGSILLNPYFILAREELQIKLYNPWTVHGGYANVLGAESKVMLNHYLKEGVQPKKLVLTGSPYCDYLKTCLDLNNRNLETSNNHNLDNQKSILVCWPPSYHNERSKLCEFDTYEDLTSAVFKFLSQLKNVTVTINLHPAVQPEFKNFVESFNINISTSYILDELVKHDIYISCYSSTVRWAIALGKPVINYDFYQFNLNEYDEAPGVLKVSKQEEFEHVMKLVLEKDQYINEIQTSQKQISTDWGMIDGLNFERIYKEINKLTL